MNLAPAAPQEPERIAKVMARAGVASRRDSEAMIAEGRVSVNGTVIDSPALDVGPADVVLVDGEALPARERTRLWLYHKPRGLVTTNHDPEGRPTVFDALPEDLPRVLSIGRLDINTEGLLLLTNDGGLARMLELPETGWLRRYRVRAFGQVTQDRLDTLRDGVTIDGVHYGPVVAQFEREQGANTWLTVDLREGKNREVKTILEHLGLQVNRLIRISFGPFQLGDIPEGEAEEIRSRVLRDQLGAELMARAGTDFESPRRDEAPVPAPARSAAPAARGRAAPGAEDRPRRRRAEPEPVKDLRGDKPWNRGVWRDEDSETPRTRRTPPRRGADPKEERQARAEDGSLVRVRDKAIADPKGRRVKVERVSSRDAAPAREEAGRDRGGEAPWQASGDWAERPQRTRHKSGEERGEHRPARESFGEERTPGRGGFGKGSFGKPSFGKTGGGKSSFGKPGGRSFGDKPAGGRSGFSKPGFGKGPRSEGARGGGPRGSAPRGGGPGRSGGGGRPSRPGGGKRD
ncbi:pseudouridine synthase [Bosea sp. TWI1241]|uniref:pseudouridine synthase n=1 Tax=Bosea sp. TWI1241 TaxID=3148904 RepID=UPI003209460D